MDKRPQVPRQVGSKHSSCLLFCHHIPALLTASYSGYEGSFDIQEILRAASEFPAVLWVSTMMVCKHGNHSI